MKLLWNTDNLADALGVQRTPPLEIDLPDGVLYSGGWDSINDNPDFYAQKISNLNKGGGPFISSEQISENMRRVHKEGKGAKNFKDPLFQEEMRRRSALRPKNLPEDHQSGTKNSQFGTFWITDGVANKKLKNGDIVPEGWYRGRK